jgi:hypothetical protein
MIELNVKEYCENCTEFEPETQTNVQHACFDDFMRGPEVIVSANTSVTCKHAQRCECIREFIEKEMKKEQEKAWLN